MIAAALAKLLLTGNAARLAFVQFILLKPVTVIITPTLAICESWLGGGMIHLCLQLRISWGMALGPLLLYCRHLQNDVYSCSSWNGFGRKSSRKHKKKRKAVWPSTPLKPAGLFGVRAKPKPILLPCCFAGPVPQLFPRLVAWLHSLSAGFYGKKLLTNFFVSIVGLWTTFFLAYSQAPV